MKIFLIIIFFLCFSGVNAPPILVLNNGSVLTQGLVACYIFDETGGGVVNSKSGYTPRYGILTNGAAWAVTTNGNAIFFDGTNDYIDGNAAANNNLLLTRTGTLMAWVNLATTAQPNNFSQFLGKRSSGNPGGYDYGMDFDKANTKIRCLISNGISFQSITGSTNISANTWYQIVFTWDGANLNNYLNGRIDATPVAQTADAQTSTLHAWEIGRGSDGIPAYFNGWISTVMVWNRALRPSEIQALYLDKYKIFTRPRIPLR